MRADIKIDAVDDPWNPVDSRLFKGFYPPEDKGSCDEGQEDKIWADIDVAKKMAKGMSLGAILASQPMLTRWLSKIPSMHSISAQRKILEPLQTGFSLYYLARTNTPM